MLKALLRRPGTQAAMAAAAGLYLDHALRTTRWTLHGAGNLAPFVAGEPGIIAFWHEMLPMTSALWLHAQRERLAAGRPAGRVHALVSRHSDGRFIGEVLRRFGVDLVHGSSSKRGEDRGGREAIRSLGAVLAAGGQVVMTPDGPRGPRRRAASGVAQIAALAGVRVLPVGAASTRMRRLPTWDEMAMPLPWGRGALVCGVPMPVASDPYAALGEVEARLTAAADEAERLCRSAP
jgi:lysophospholipid acyltransferase (LPLAT)-like uncharacterized protein